MLNKSIKVSIQIQLKLQCISSIAGVCTNKLSL